MVAELAIDVNALRFVVADEYMQIEIMPERRLAPVAGIPNDQQPALTYLAGLGRSSQGTQWGALCAIAAVLTAGQCNPLTLPWASLRRQHVNAVRAWLVDNRSPATGRRVMAALKGTIKECWRLDLISTEDYMKTIDIKPIRGSTTSQAAGRSLSAGEIVAILAACKADPTAAGLRDAAILGLGARCGLRRAEMAALTMDDYDIGRQMIMVHGKGRKTRNIYPAPGVDVVLSDWLHVRGNAPGRLLLAVHKTGAVLPKGISAASIYNTLLKRAKEAGVREFSPHDLRRTFAGDQLDAGTDISTLQKLMGHADPKTTAGYDRRDERAKRDAAGRLHFPWERRYAP